jgi:hypothetical protein
MEVISFEIYSKICCICGHQNYGAAAFYFISFLPGEEHKMLDKNKTQTRWPESVRELHQLRDRSSSAKLVPTFAERGFFLVRVTDPYGRILCFIDRSRYFFFQAAPQLYSRGWMDPVPDPLFFRKSVSAGNRTWAFGSVATRQQRRSRCWTSKSNCNFS